MKAHQEAVNRIFKADPSVVGRSILIRKRPFTIVGVAEAGFTGLEAQRLGGRADDGELPRLGVRHGQHLAMNASFLSLIPGGLRIRVRLQPRAAHNRIVGQHGDSLKAQVTAPPVEGEANRALARLLADALGVPKGKVSVAVGGRSRNKLVQVEGLSAGTFIEKTARKLQIATEQLAQMPYQGLTLHKISSKCGIFAEADSNTLVKSGVPVEEIIASLFEAVVYQNLATLTKGNTPQPGVIDE